MTGLALFAASAGAQLPALAAGSHLKIELTSHQQVEGTLMSQGSDSLVIAAEGARLMNVPTANVGRIKSTMGRSHGAGAKKGLKLGTIIGGGFGVLLGLGYMSDDGSGYTDDGLGSAAPVAFGVVGALEGAFYGVIIGAIAGAQDWKPIYERPYSVAVTPAAGSLRVGLRIRY